MSQGLVWFGSSMMSTLYETLFKMLSEIQKKKNIFLAAHHNKTTWSHDSLCQCLYKEPRTWGEGRLLEASPGIFQNHHHLVIIILNPIIITMIKSCKISKSARIFLSCWCWPCWWVDLSQQGFSAGGCDWAPQQRLRLGSGSDIGFGLRDGQEDHEGCWLWWWFWKSMAKLHYTSCLDGVWIKMKKVWINPNNSHDSLDRSKLRPSQTPTNHPLKFFW